MTEEEPRRLRGQKSAATCCVASNLRPGLIATAAEDGCICWYDLRCKDMLFAMDVGNGNAISSLCFKPGNSVDTVKQSEVTPDGNETHFPAPSYTRGHGTSPAHPFLHRAFAKVSGGTVLVIHLFFQGNEDIVYVSSGNEIKCFDLHMTPTWKLLKTYSINKDEINQIACHPKSSFLAAADDSGDVKIIDVSQQCPFKTLRAGHEIICSSVQFLPWKSWEVITGGLDSKLVMWDFSKGRACHTIDFGRDGAAQSCNPAFVHAIVVPDLDMVERVGKICVAARGDGVVSIIDIESEVASLKSKSSSKSKQGAKSTTPKNSIQDANSQSEDLSCKNLLLDYTVGGHSAAVSSVAFSTFGEKGKFVISGGNDKSVKVWDWSKSYDAGHTSSVINNLLSLNISLRRKVNWLCTTPSESENLVICDTSKVVKVYTIR